MGKARFEFNVVDGEEETVAEDEVVVNAEE